MTDVQKNKILDMESAGFGYAKIASALGLSPNTVKSYLARQKRMPPQVRCRFCGKPIASPRVNQVYCSPECSRKWWVADRRKGRQYRGVCEYCGADMTMRYTGEKRFCSKSCAAKARNRGGEAYAG